MTSRRSMWRTPYVALGCPDRHAVLGQVLLYDFPPCGVNDKTSSKNLCCKPDPLRMILHQKEERHVHLGT